MAFASGTLTEAGAFADTETVVIGPKTYTMQATLTNVDGHVLIGADSTASMLNLKNAINLGSGAGTTYAAATVAHPLVVAISSGVGTLVVRAKLDGVIGNQIATTETGASTSWANTTLTGGTGDTMTSIRALALQAPAWLKQAIIDLTDPEGDE